MSSSADSPSENVRRVSARVMASLSPGRITLQIAPGVSLADGGIPIEVDAALVPPHLRMPNSEFTVLMAPTDRGLDVVAVEA